MVCLGNICRSPMAEAVFRAKVESAGLDAHIAVASAGTGTWHVGERPHAGTLRVLVANGLSLPGKVAHHISEFDLGLYQYIVPMDRANRDALGFHAPLLLEYAGGPEGVVEVPDPYYDDTFERVFGLVDAGAEALLRHIVAGHGLAPDPSARSRPAPAVGTDRPAGSAR
jgi:protein-tyrosine phosphatase